MYKYSGEALSSKAQTAGLFASATGLTPFKLSDYGYEYTDSSQDLEYIPGINYNRTDAKTTYDYYNEGTAIEFANHKVLPVPYIVEHNNSYCQRLDPDIHNTTTDRTNHYCIRLITGQTYLFYRETRQVAGGSVPMIILQVYDTDSSLLKEEQTYTRPNSRMLITLQAAGGTGGVGAVGSINLGVTKLVVSGGGGGGGGYMSLYVNLVNSSLGLEVRQDGIYVYNGKDLDAGYLAVVQTGGDGSDGDISTQKASGGTSGSVEFIDEGNYNTNAHRGQPFSKAKGIFVVDWGAGTQGGSGSVASGSNKVNGGAGGYFGSSSKMTIGYIDQTAKDLAVVKKSGNSYVDIQDNYSYGELADNSTASRFAGGGGGGGSRCGNGGGYSTSPGPGGGGCGSSAWNSSSDSSTAKSYSTPGGAYMWFHICT